MARLAKFLRLSLQSSALLAGPRGHETGLVARQGGRLPSGATNRGAVHAERAPGCRVPHISLVFREMWDTTALHPEPLVASKS